MVWIMLALAAGFVGGAGTVRFNLFRYRLLARMPRQTLAGARKDYFEALGGTAKVAFVGDSILRSVEWAEELPGRSVVNRAIGGDTSEGVVARIDPLIALNAQTYVVMLGTNDPAKGCSPEETAANVQRIVDALPGRKVVLGIPPSQTAERLNAHLANLSGAKFCASELTAADLADGVHPNAAGIAKLVETVKTAI